MKKYKYFIYKIDNKEKQRCSKTSAASKNDAISNIILFENCIKKDIKIMEISLSMYSFPADQLWKLYDKPFKVKMIGRRALKILGYAEHGVRIKYVDTGEECTVHASVIKEFTPKSKRK